MRDEDKLLDVVPLLNSQGCGWPECFHLSSWSVCVGKKGVEGVDGDRGVEPLVEDGGVITSFDVGPALVRDGKAAALEDDQERRSKALDATFDATFGFEL